MYVYFIHLGNKKKKILTCFKNSNIMKSMQFFFHILLLYIVIDYIKQKIVNQNNSFLFITVRKGIFSISFFCEEKKKIKHLSAQYFSQFEK